MADAVRFCFGNSQVVSFVSVRAGNCLLFASFFFYNKTIRKQYQIHVRKLCADGRAAEKKQEEKG